MFRMLIEFVSIYNKLEYKIKPTTHTNNKINVFDKKLLCKNLVPDTSKTKTL